MSAQVSKSALRQRNKNAVEVRVTMLGLDRITGSLGLAMRNFNNRPSAPVYFHVIGRDENKDVMKAAHRQEMIDDFRAGLREAVQNADIVFYNLPVSQQEETFKRLGEHLKSGAVVLDLSPVKSPGVKMAEKHFPHDMEGDARVHLVGVTLLQGFEGVYNTDTSIETAGAFLFHKNDLLVVPSARASRDAIKLVTDLAEFLEMTPRFMDPAEYDGLTALTEGMPILMAMLLVQTLNQSAGRLDLLRVTDSTFGVATHALHNKNADDLMELIGNNKQNLVHHIDQLMSSLEVLRDYLKEPDPNILKAYFEQILNHFTEWEIRRRDNEWEDPMLDNASTVAVAPNFMSRMLLGGRKKQDDE